jgi:putative protease
LSSLPPTPAPRPSRPAPPELLSPAGNWDCARAAVANGADAIFFGLPRFNARLRADNFTEEDLPELMAFLHKHGVRGYCAFNTLIFTGELEDAEKQLRLLESAGVDAVIVQDLGLARMVKALAPKLHLHASTQMTITSPEGLRFARNLGLDLAVLSRELSLRDLEAFKKDAELPLEVFVHGALCVAYSGQCLTSESLGRRSANRGECAQACRMPYELVVDGELRDLGDKRYLLSPQDLAAVEEIPSLIAAGIHSFKIEGRLKSPEYVAAVTRVYRKAIDTALEALENDQPLPPQLMDEEDRYSLEMTFSRGLFSGWMHGVNHQQLVGARFAKKRGPLVGEVRTVDRDTIELTPFQIPLKPGDGVVFENPSDTDHEQGGYLFQVQGSRIAFQRGKIDFTSIQPGTRVYKTADPALERELQATFKGDLPIRKRRALHFTVTGQAGQPLVVEVRDLNGGVNAGLESPVLAQASSAMPLEVAQKKPLTPETLAEQFGRLGGTPYELAGLDAQLEGAVIVPVSELNRLRRALVAALDLLPTAPVYEAPSPEGLKSSARAMLAPLEEARLDLAPAVEARLYVLCRSMEQIDAALAAGVTRLYVDFEDVRLYPDAVQHVRAHNSARAAASASGPQTATEIFLATPRIQKPREEGFFKLIARANPDGVLIRNLGAIAFFAGTGLRTTGDFSLNVANPLTAEFLKTTGLEQLTVSYDLNIEQVLDLLYGCPPTWFELTLHQHMPMFHMEHCVFASFMSNGKSFLDCGRPCERHKVKLRDRTGMEHPLKADVGCRNTLFNAVPQTGARFYEMLYGAGLRTFRVEFLEESGPEAAQTLALYQDLMSHRRNGETLWRDLKAQSQLGVTSGTLRDRERDPLIAY